MSIAYSQSPIAFIVSFLINLVRNTTNLLRTASTPYHLANSCPSGGGGGGSTPCTCNYPTGFSSTYTVGGFGSASACGTCDASTDPAWPGTMYHVGSGCTWWAIDSNFDPYNINGVSLDISYTQLRLNGTASPCRWELVISCGSIINPPKTVWFGVKTTGSTPVGTYTFVSSQCGTGPSTMTVT
jgi:hypothetical protein